jgi:basic membrane lipoprotein Med (substrate-binding protein (PBP1-ABC) superfamily)
MYKKGLKIGGIVSSVSAVTLSIALPLVLMDKSKDIVFIANKGSIRDGTFNQQGYEATQDFAEKANLSYGGLEPGAGSRHEFAKIYEDAYKEGAELLVLSGFAHDAS